MADIASKHVVHSGVAPEVRCAGTFRILEDPKVKKNNLQQRCSVLIDNDSGTYRPKKEHLQLVKQVLQLNFPKLQVYALDCTVPQPPETLTFLGPDEIEDSPNCVYAGTGKYKFVAEDDDHHHN